MRKVIWRNILAVILVMALLVSMVPAQVFAEAGETLTSEQEPTAEIKSAIENTLASNSVLGPNIQQEFLEEAHIVHEDENRRGENFKEYILSNGSRLVTVYPTAVHYEENGVWKDFDNTLIAVISNHDTVYMNTAGPWSIHFPQSLSVDNAIGITTDGYTVQFGIVGEMRSNGGGLVVASSDQIVGDNISETLTVCGAQVSFAQVEQNDLMEARAVAKYPETVLSNLSSRISYANIFQNTNVVYDLQGNQLKESIILEQYDSSLRGYRYNLDVGNLVPMLCDDRRIDLCDPETDEVVLTMPAPYMVDNNGSFNDDVEVSLIYNGSSYLLSYYLPAEWLAEEDRAWPVVLDPIVTKPGRYDIVDDRTFKETSADSVSRGVLVCGSSATNGKMRFLMRFMELPELTSADTIINATISLKQAVDYDTPKVVEVHKVTGSWASTANLTWGTMPDIDESIEDYAVCQLVQRYEWNITDIVRDWYDSENTGMMFKASDEIEESGEGNWVQFYSSDYGTSSSVMPMLTITYHNTNGLESYWNYASVSAGRAGAGYVNRFTGNLTWVRSDLGFDGNRMPVSISHIYNSNDANNNRFGMGYGWRTNYNQTVTKASTDLYAWEDGDGTKHYFVPDGNGTYADLDGLDLTLTVVTSDDFILTDMYGNTSEFTNNMLTRMVNNQATESDIEITYNDSGLISQVADGVGRKYNFVYTDGLLSRISYTSDGNVEITYITYSYSNGNLIRIIDRDSSFTAYAYSNRLLVRVNDVGGYYITYAYSSGAIKRVAEIKEYYESTMGSSMTLTYSTHCTEVKDHKDNYMRYQFNDWGDLVATHDSYGHTQYTKYTLNDVDDPIPSTAEVHQVSENSNEKGTAINHFADSSFEGGEKWTSYSGWYVATISTDTAYLGNNSMKMSGATNGGECRVIGPYIDVYDGETYTFSTYVLPEEGAKASIAFVTSNYTVLSSSIIEEATNDWVRLQVSYTNEGSTVVRVFPHIAVNTGVMYVDCVQLEKAEAASDYNLLENGEFKITISEGVSYLEGWTESSDCTTEDHYYGSAAANSALDTGVYHMKGNPSADKYLSQTVTMSGETGDTFVLAGWARANAVSCLDGREFGLKLIFHNTDGTTTEYFASFDPEISFQQWQYAALTAIATKVYNTVTVQVVYSQQANVAYFDGIQLYADRIGTSYSYDSNKNLISETNILGQTTTYEYYENGVDLKSVDAPVGSDVSYEYDTYHNVTKVTEKAVDPSGTQYTTSYTYAYDVYGNITSTTVTQGSYVQKSVTTYSSDGNYAVTATDGNGDTTTYGYDTDTGVLLWVQYPEDTDGTENTRDTRTYYEYDNMYRLEQISTDTDKNVEMSAAYSYENDLLETLTTQTTTYSFGYGKFDLRTSVTIGTQLVASYTYTDDESHYLQRLDYSNGDSVEYTYDNLGRVTTEKYYENNSGTASRTITYTYDNAGALAITEDSATDITTICYYDFAGRVVKLVETNDIDYYHVSMYGYDGNGNVYAMLEYINGEDFCTEFDYDYKNRIASVTTMDAERRYSYDSFDRVTRRVTSKVNGETTSTVLRQNISYLSVTVEGQTLTTNRVEQIATIANNYRKTYTYTYDGNGNITSVSDGTYTTTYEYDSANQLIRENNQAAGKTWVWTYDGAGNILSKGECSYTTALECTVSAPIVYRYGKNGWGDVLVGYGNKNLSYDSIGNLLRDGTYTYTWEQGRQLARMSRGSAYWEYTYDSNGMRTGRTSSSGMAYTYVYNGSQLSMMTCGTDVLYFSYDAAGTPMTVRYNGTTYYYVTNLQGDVIAILNGSGTAVVQYTYDAWGALLSSTDNSGTGLGARNPLRYRGYVYDVETGLYYLQSRYYAPTIGRFINADSLVFIGQCVLGNNMFAYCLNNPANGCDPCGTCFHRWDFWNDCEKCGGKTIGDKWNGIAQWCEDAYNYVTNTDESVVLSTQKVSFYRGAMVIRADIGSRGGGASFGIILLDDFYTYDETGIADLKHEYGHFVHMRQIGIPSYILTTAIPSGIGAIIADQKGTGIRKFVSDHYVSQPWERIAEHLGGVTGGTYLPGANTAGSLYWLYTQFVGVVFH